MTTRESIATKGLKSCQEEMRSLGFMSLKDLTDEILRVRKSIQSANGTRKLFHPVRRVDA